MKFSVTTTPGHEGKIFEVNTNNEVITIYGSNGALLGAISWKDIIERIITSDEDVRFAHARAHARAPLAVKVKYTTPKGSSSTV